MSHFGKVGLSDGPNLDAFSRLRVSDPSYAFDAQLTYDLAPLQFEQLTSGTGATITHDSTNRCASLALSSSPTGAYAYMQTYEWIRYQPGRSQAFFITFSFGSGVADVLKFAGIGTNANGIRFELAGSQPRIVLYSDTDHGDEIVNQDDWNLDTMDGNGGSANPSGLLLDATKMQILAIDFQALYAGRVRVGFDIGGQLIYVHEFNHANIDSSPYIQNASLPIQAGLQYTGGTTATASMKFICCSAISEGGQQEVGGYSFSYEATGTAASGADTHILSLRPRTTFNSIANRSKMVLDSIDIVVTGNFPVAWYLAIGQAISGTTTFNDVNATYSAVEYNTAGTLSGSPAIVLMRGYVPSSGSVRGTSEKAVTARYPITLDAAGAARALGTLSVVAQGIGGAPGLRVSANWREIR